MSSLPSEAKPDEAVPLDEAKTSDEDLYASHVKRLAEEAKKELQEKLPQIMRKAYFDMLVEALDGLKEDGDEAKREKTLQMFLGLYQEICSYLVRIACEGNVDESFKPLPSVNEATKNLVGQIREGFDQELFERIIRHDALDKRAVLSMVRTTAHWMRILLFKPLVPRFDKDCGLMEEALGDPEVSLGKATSLVLDKLFFWLD